MTPQQVFKNLALAAVAWRDTKRVFVRAGDSRSSKPAEIDAAKRKHLEAVRRLEAAVADFEKLLQSGPSKRKKPFPWKAVLDGVATVTGVLKSATDVPGAPRRIIDVEAEVVSSPPR
jgi:hypothetical protein